MAARATKAQVEALRWLLRDDADVRRIPANALMKLYEDRARAEADAGRRGDYGWQPNTNRLHAWRRTSGRVMNQMAKAGLVKLSGFGAHGAAFYSITDDGRAAAEGTMQ